MDEVAGEESSDGLIDRVPVDQDDGAGFVDGYVHRGEDGFEFVGIRRGGVDRVAYDPELSLVVGRRVLAGGEQGEHGVETAVDEPGDLLFPADPPVLETGPSDPFGYGEPS